MCNISCNVKVWAIPLLQLLGSFSLALFLRSGLLEIIIECLLPLSVVPVECARDAVNPVLASPLQRQHGGEREARRRDGDIVAWLKLRSARLLAQYCTVMLLYIDSPLLPIKARPTARASIIRHPKPQHRGVRQDDRAETQRMRRDRRDEHDRVLRVAQTTSSGKVVRR